METLLDQRPPKRQRLEARPGDTTAAAPSLSVTSSGDLVDLSNSRSPRSPPHSPSIVGGVSVSPTASSTPVIDHAAFPHIFDAILSDAPPAALPVLRAVSRHLRDWADRRICKHLAVCPPASGLEAHVLSANITAEKTVVTRPPPLYLRNTTGRWQLTPGHADVEWLARGDNVLKATTVVDIVGDAKQFDLVASLLPHLRTVRFHETSDLDQIKNIHADQGVLFTRPEARSDRGRGPPDLAVRRLVTHVGVPLLHEDSERDYSHDPTIGFYIWSPAPPIPAVTEMVYIFDPAWYRADISRPPNISFTRMLQSVVGLAARSLMNTQFAFVGLEQLPIAALDMPNEDASYYTRQLNYLDYGDFGNLHHYWNSLGSSYVRRNGLEKLEWMWMLHQLNLQLNLPQGLTVEEVRSEMEQAVRADWGGEAKRSRRARQARRSIVRAVYRYIRYWQRSDEAEDCPYRPLAEWPAEKLHGYVEERLKFLTYEEYRSSVSEEQRLLETVGYA